MQVKSIFSDAGLVSIGTQGAVKYSSVVETLCTEMLLDSCIKLNNFLCRRLQAAVIFTFRRYSELLISVSYFRLSASSLHQKSLNEGPELLPTYKLQSAHNMAYHLSRDAFKALTNWEWYLETSCWSWWVNPLTQGRTYPADGTHSTWTKLVASSKGVRISWRRFGSWAVKVRILSTSESLLAKFRPDHLQLWIPSCDIISL